MPSHTASSEAREKGKHSWPERIATESLDVSEGGPFVKVVYRLATYKTQPELTRTRVWKKERYRD